MGIAMLPDPSSLLQRGWYPRPRCGHIYTCCTDARDRDQNLIKRSRSKNGPIDSDFRYINFPVINNINISCIRTTTVEDIKLTGSDLGMSFLSFETTVERLVAALTLLTRHNHIQEMM